MIDKAVEIIGQQSVDGTYKESDEEKRVSLTSNNQSAIQAIASPRSKSGQQKRSSEGEMYCIYETC